MINFETLAVIAKAKFSDKSNLGDWYQKRMDICKECPLNSANTGPRNARDRAWLLANLGRPTCFGCGCEIAAKNSVRGETCGAVKEGLPALWGPLPEMADLDFRDLTIVNLNTDKATITTGGRGIEVNYGVVPNSFESTVSIELTSNKGPITQIKVVPGCGCTMATTRVDNGKAIFSLAYDTINRYGGVTKSFTVYYTVGKKQHVLMGKLLIDVESKK